jgi:carbamoyl-phosphate synthase large subunit
MTVEGIYELSRIDRWFLHNIRQIIGVENEIRAYRERGWQSIPVTLLEQAKEYGFSDIQLARLLKTDEVSVFKLRHEKGVLPAYKLVDTCAAEFEAFTPYFYSTYETENEILERRSG